MYSIKRLNPELTKNEVTEQEKVGGAAPELITSHEDLARLADETVSAIHADAQTTISDGDSRLLRSLKSLGVDKNTGDAIAAENGIPEQIKEVQQQISAIESLTAAEVQSIVDDQNQSLDSRDGDTASPDTGRTLELLKNEGIEIESDEPLSEQDLQFIFEIKRKMETTAKPEEKKQIKIHIISEKKWNEKMKQINSDKQFNGQAWADTKNDGTASVVIPSSDVFRQETPYKKLYSQSPQMRSLIDEDPAAAYQNIYLRNILAHEIAHIYQKSDNYEGAPTTEEGVDPYEDLQEFMSCAYGLHEMQLPSTDSDKYTPAFLEANQITLDAQTGGYAQKQAERTTKANIFLAQFDNSPYDFESVFAQMNQICQSGGLRKRELQDSLRQMTSSDISKENVSQFCKKIEDMAKN